jgi:3-hydroxyacyl-CoA dehydrogenase
MLFHYAIHLEPYANEILEALFEDRSYKKRVRRTLLETAPSHAAANSVRAGIDVRINSSVSRYSRSPHIICVIFSGVVIF